MNTGGPAFPQHGWAKDPEVAQRMGNQGGMTLLDWMAGQALVGSLASQSKESHWAFATVEYETADDIVIKGVAALCYDLASAMLAEKARREADHSGDVTKMVEINRELVEALEVLVCGAEKVRKKGYVFAQLNLGVVTARAALAKAKEAKP